MIGHALDAVLALARRSWHTHRLLYALDERTRERLGRLRACTAARAALRDVPAYRALFAEHGERPAMRFTDLPITDKTGYIQRYGIAATCRGGVLPRGGVIDESSGASGTATAWVRGPAERAATGRSIRHAARAVFGERDFIVINAFALGPWATGMALAAALSPRHLVKSTGPDIAKITATFAQLGSSRPYLVAGYPPFLKLLCDTAPIEWARYEVHAVVGGEGMSEPLRAALDRCFRQTRSSFGASDLEINIAAETAATIALRRHWTPELARALVGRTDGVPMIFQYDPLDYLLETDAADNLLVTINALAKVSPRIRYNLHDRARVVRRRDAVRVLAELGMPPLLAARPHLPLLLHWGRQDHAVAFFGCKLTPADLQHAVLRVPELAAAAAELALHADDAGLELWIELRPDANVTITPTLEATVIQRLAEANQDFRESIQMAPRERWPRLRVFPHGTSPLAGQDARIKRRYIFRQSPAL